MAGHNQLPLGTEGVAAFCLVYSSTSWICSVLLVWCARLHREAWSYISMLAYFALISDTASIIQQAYDITYYQDLLAGQFHRKTTFLQNPELAIANGSFGLDLILFYIQYYSYNVESMLVMFWAFELAQSVYGFSAKLHLKRPLKRVNSAGKVVAVLFPLVTILLLRAPAIQRVFVAFILLADLPLMVSLAVSSVAMVAILIKYVQSRKKLSNWTSQDNETAASHETSTETIQTAGSLDVTKSSGSHKRHGLYDRWLMVRFTVAFVILAVFEVTNTLFQLQSIRNNNKDATLTAPDLSAERARTTLFLYLPGVTPGIFLFLVFGTTAGCRAVLRGLLPCSPKTGRKRARQPITGHVPHGSTDGDASFTAQNPFVDSSEADSKREEEEDGPIPLLPVAGLVSKYNRSFNLSRKIAEYPTQHQEDKASPLPGRLGGILVRAPQAVKSDDLASMKQIREEYYQPSPEQSDDSGPILPIMSPRTMRFSNSRAGLTMFVAKH